jgi:hypothetical protein
MKVVKFEDGLYAVRRWGFFRYEYLWIGPLFRDRRIIWDMDRDGQHFIEYATTHDRETAERAMEVYKSIKSTPKRGAGVPV